MTQANLPPEGSGMPDHGLIYEKPVFLPDSGVVRPDSGVDTVKGGIPDIYVMGPEMEAIMGWYNQEAKPQLEGYNGQIKDMKVLQEAFANATSEISATEFPSFSKTDWEKWKSEIGEGRVFSGMEQWFIKADKAFDKVTATIKTLQEMRGDVIAPGLIETKKAMDAAQAIMDKETPGSDAHQDAKKDFDAAKARNDGYQSLFDSTNTLIGEKVTGTPQKLTDEQKTELTTQLAAKKTEKAGKDQQFEGELKSLEDQLKGQLTNEQTAHLQNQYAAKKSEKAGMDQQFERDIKSIESQLSRGEGNYTYGPSADRTGDRSLWKVQADLYTQLSDVTTALQYPQYMHRGSISSGPYMVPKNSDAVTWSKIPGPLIAAATKPGTTWSGPKLSPPTHRFRKIDRGHTSVQPGWKYPPNTNEDFRVLGHLDNFKGPIDTKTKAFDEISNIETEIGSMNTSVQTQIKTIMNQITPAFQRLMGLLNTYQRSLMQIIESYGRR